MQRNTDIGLFTKPSTLKNIRIVISSGSEFCHFERQREIFNKQDSSSLLLLGMTTAKASKIILNILEFLRSQPGGGVGDA